jgi:hypothetical protein
MGKLGDSLTGVCGSNGSLSGGEFGVLPMLVQFFRARKAAELFNVYLFAKRAFFGAFWGN